MTATMPRRPEQAPASNGGELPFAGARGRRLWTAVCTAAVAVVASIVAAAGPAHGNHAVYAWPPPELPRSTPKQGWYAPLPLLNRVPASIVVRIPCGLSNALRRRPESTVIATARRPGKSDALRIALRGRSLGIDLGATEVARLPWPAACPLVVQLKDGQLRLADRTILLHTETPGEMPIVTGLFSELDLRTGARPAIAVTTRDYSTSATASQLVAGALAVILALFALWRMSAARLSPQRDWLFSRLAGVWRRLDRVDAVVVVVLAVWWIAAPAHIDDGWIWAQSRTFADFGSVTYYFDFWGATVPTSWLTWLERWAIASTNDLVVMRLPVLGVLVATWLVCRKCLNLAVGGVLAGRSRWVLATAYLVGSVAWAMSLRPEPVVGLLAVGCLWAMLSFAQAPRTSSLVIATVTIVLALLAHPTGIVVAAPLIAGLPLVIRSLRSFKVLVGTSLGLALAAFALLVVFIFFDADWSHRLNDAEIARSGHTHSYSVWDEYIRYTHFDEGAGQPLLRLSLALMLLCVVAALFRMRSISTTVSLLPARSIGIGLASLALVPSKWPWHFGALAALAAIAAAAEIERLVRENEARVGTTRQFVAVGVVYGAAFLAWSAPLSLTAQGLIGLQEVRWRDGFNDYTWLAACLLVYGVVIAATISSRRRRPVSDQLARITAWSLVGFSSLVVVLTLALQVADAVASRWSPARQNLEALTGASGCGLGDHIGGNTAIIRGASVVLVHPAVGVYFPCVTIPRVRGGLVEMPDAIVTHEYFVLLQRDSPFAAAADLYELRRTPERPFQGMDVNVVIPLIRGYERVDAVAN
jgi:hypothetical protein